MSDRLRAAFEDVKEQEGLSVWQRLTKAANGSYLLLSATLIILLKAPWPFVWISLLWSGSCLLISARFARRPGARMFWICCSAAIVTIGAFELYLTLRTEARQVHIFGIRPQTQHESLGYAPIPNTVAAGLVMRKDEYVTTLYTINHAGLRVSYPLAGATTPDTSDCVVFFGGSYTFGTGVRDEESMPYRVGLKTAGSKKVYNFGYGGYGPHQMLSAIEHGLVRSRVSCKGQTTFVYQFIPTHVARAAGATTWDTHGPRYILAGDSVSYAGHFDDSIWKLADRVFRRSTLYGRSFGPDRPMREADENLFVGIVKRSRDILIREWPGSDFQVIAWDNKDSVLVDRLLDGLFKAQIATHRVTRDVLPDYRVREAEYRLHALDSHPSPMAHDRIADYVVDRIL